ncbi:ATP-dependent DNA ligase [Streptomyces humicola]|nr:ATP-dependent DNA ligase [Streptomyces humicola]
MLARPVDHLPSSRGPLPMEPKWDGWRLVILTGPVRLQTRPGRFITDRFPEIAAAAEAVPAGTVLDGELVVWRNKRLDFVALQSRVVGVGTMLPPASYVAFDLLALRDGDMRQEPYEARRAALVELLAPLGPPLQPTSMTTDPDEAADWYETLSESGIEGLVIKRFGQPYMPDEPGWMKIRHAVPQDAVAMGIIDPQRCPAALVIDYGDGPISATVDPAQARLLAELATPGAEGQLPDGTHYVTLVDPVPVEIRQGGASDARTVVTRVRGDAG